jgi:ABC-type glycerol-3-phosphate transport system substrate-binding protein
MTCNGAWFMSDIKISPLAGKVKFFTFPYVAQKPQFKGDSILFPGGLILSGKMTGPEKAMAIEFVKLFTNKEMSAKLVLCGNLTARRDSDLATIELDQTTKDIIAYMGSITKPGGDYSDYDVDLALLEKSRVAIQGLLLQNSPETAAKTVQAEVDKFEKAKKK